MFLECKTRSNHNPKKMKWVKKKGKINKKQKKEQTVSNNNSQVDVKPLEATALLIMSMCFEMRNPPPPHVPGNI